jgi:hypothetical protein
MITHDQVAGSILHIRLLICKQSNSTNGPEVNIPKATKRRRDLKGKVIEKERERVNVSEEGD